MEYRYLGNTSVKVSSFCLGTMNFGNPTSIDDAHKMLEFAIDNGINFLNMADMDYSGRSEEIVGKFLQGYQRREKLFLSVEISGPDMGVPEEPNLSRKYIFQAIDKALKRLGTDYIDLYNIPRPNYNIPIEETLSALTDLVHAGKIRYIGTSTFPAWMVIEAILLSEKNGFVKPVAELSPYNILDRRIENELIPMALKYSIGIIPWAPLAQGVLAGRYDNYPDFPKDSRAARIGGIYKLRVTKQGVKIASKLTKLASNSGKTLAQFSYLWVKNQPGVVAPIVGVRTLKQLKEFVPVFEKELSQQELNQCDNLVSQGSAITSFFNSAPWMKMSIGSL